MTSLIGWSLLNLVQGCCIVWSYECVDVGNSYRNNCKLCPIGCVWRLHIRLRQEWPFEAQTAEQVGEHSCSLKCPHPPFGTAASDSVLGENDSPSRLVWPQDIYGVQWNKPRMLWSDKPPIGRLWAFLTPAFFSLHWHLCQGNIPQNNFARWCISRVVTRLFCSSR